MITNAISNTNIQSLVDPLEILNTLLKTLNNKEQEIISRRYGLGNKEIDTLASIGKDFTVTRERIRQIQVYGFKKLQRNVHKTKLTDLQNWALNTLKEQGDIVTEKTFENLLKTKFPQYKNNIQELKLASILFNEIVHENNKINIRVHFRNSNISLKSIKNICTTARKILKNKAESMSQNQLVSQIQDQIKTDNLNLRKKLILAAVKLDRRIKVKSDSISLTKWRHVNPKTLYDKIFFVLRKQKSPLHFSEITNKIIDKKFDNKSVSQQAVHNELINRTDFILVGRGVYALAEWGYKEGTVTQVIQDILQTEGPQSYEQLLDSVLQRRKVKQITVQININNKKLFARDHNDVVSLMS